MNFDYFYNREGDRFSFFMLPKVLITDEAFKSLSSDAKILYACLLDRTTLSYKNKWFDGENRVYIIFTIDEVMESVNVAKATASKNLSELEKIGLIERKRRGLGKPNIIYVKDFMSIFNHTSKSSEIELQEIQNMNSRSSKNILQEVQKLNGTNTNINNTDYSNTNFSNDKSGYGTFQNVFLTDDELTDLKEKIKNDLDNYIERLSNYIQSTGKEYKDHKSTILTWFYKDQGNNHQKAKSKNKSYSLEDYEKGFYL